MEFGLFFAVANMRPLIVFVPAQLVSVFFPKLGQCRASGNKRTYVKYARLSIITAMISSVALGGVITVFSKNIMSIFGPEFAEEWFLLVLISINGAFLAVSVALSYLMISNEKMWANFLICLVSFPMGILLTVYLQNYVSGAYALVLGNGGAQLLGVLMMLFMLRNNLSYREECRILA